MVCALYLKTYLYVAYAYGVTSSERKKKLAITIAEAQQRRAEARRIEFESSILRQWYYALAETLVDQAKRQLSEPDFSSHWLMCPEGLLAFLRESGVEATLDNWHEAVIDFINELIGDQLEEYGIEVRLKPVSNGLSGSNRLFLLKPGQLPTYN